MSEQSLIRDFHENERDLVDFLAARLKSVFLAQDLVQEMYLRLRGLEAPEKVANGRAYLFRMAANLAIDHQRKESRRAEILAEAQDILTQGLGTPSPEEALIARDELARLEHAFAGLPEISRRIFQLSRFEGLSQREIAERVGLSPTAVFKHLRKVLDHLARARDA